MKAKLLLAHAALMICLIACLMMLAQAQLNPQDPLGSNIYTMPGETRSVGGDSQRVYINPNADPLSIAPLARPIDPEHSAEYLSMVTGREDLATVVPISQELGGNWRMNLSGTTPGALDLFLVLNRDAVFGQGALVSLGTVRNLSASGWMAADVLHLDLVDPQNMVLYRCTLTVNDDFLSGSFNAYDAQGGAWSGPMQGRKQS